MRTEIIQANLGTGSESHPYLINDANYSTDLAR